MKQSTSESLNLNKPNGNMACAHDYCSDDSSVSLWYYHCCCDDDDDDYYYFYCYCYRV